MRESTGHSLREAVLERLFLMVVLSLFFLGLWDDCHRVHIIQGIMNRELFKAYNTISSLSSSPNLFLSASRSFSIYIWESRLDYLSLEIIFGQFC
ncbi:hypothetical protein EUGRSUZ_B01959 [Eucalyptus grandis]|uniref:Uncharacterized protein n=2 Tax=Eucalyptus grandis TaxID=71139 RepID=A0A059D3F2_EUCGR|nr:hypothetical protein EUGRSUZ_B01959 [Eucalyptus grandis]